VKSLVVYYSRSGRTRKVGELIAQKLKSDIEEIVDKQNRSGMKGYLFSGRDAFLNKFTQIQSSDVNLSNYDLVIIGSPIWAGKMPPAIRTFLNVSSAKKVGFYCTCGGSDSRRIFADMHSIMVDSKLLGTLRVTKKEMKFGVSKKVDFFARKLKVGAKHSS